MSSLRQGFLADIVEHPEDDAPRLIFADWLDDNGDPERAEFIRLQCRLVAGDRYDPDRRPLVAREAELLGKHGKQWMKREGLQPHIDPESLDHWQFGARYRRGFVEFAQFISPDHYLRCVEELRRLTPLVGIGLHMPYNFASAEESQRAMNTFQRKYFERLEQQLGSLVNAMAAQFASADPEFPEPHEFRQLVHSPAFARLRDFRMDSIHGDRQHLGILLSSPHLAGLRSLDLSGNALIQGEDWEPLGNTPALAGLESLALARTHLGEPGLRAILGSPYLSKLRHLELESDRWEMGPAGYRILATHTRLPRLESLGLHGQRGGAGGLLSLRDWQGLAHLVRLDLSFNYTDNDDEEEYNAALWSFAHSPHWSNLRELVLDGDSAAPLSALEALLDSPNLATLRVLSLDHAYTTYEDELPLQDEAARLLIGCPHLTDRLELHFSEGGLSPVLRRQLRDRFGDGLVLYPNDGLRHRRE